MPGVVRCQVRGSRASDNDIVRYDWNLGDGTIAGGATVTHSYAQPGTYQVTLTVTDDKGATSTATRIILIQVTTPVAAINAPTNGLVNQPITFDGSDSTANGGSIVSYTWTFGDGASASGPTVTHAYTQPGNYTINLTVTISNGLAATAQHTIQIKLPQQSVKAAISAPNTGQVGQPISFDGSGSSASTGPDQPVRLELWRWWQWQRCPGHTYLPKGRALPGDPDGDRQRWGDRPGATRHPDQEEVSPPEFDRS
jgi:PKD repeat protein